MKMKKMMMMIIIIIIYVYLTPSSLLAPTVLTWRHQEPPRNKPHCQIPECLINVLRKIHNSLLLPDFCARYD